MLKRRAPTTEDDLRKQLQSAPEAGFDQQATTELYTPIIKSLNANPPSRYVPADVGLMSLHEKAALDARPDMVSLPWLLKSGNELSKEDAEHLQTLSLKLRGAMQKASTRRDGIPDPDKLAPLLTAKDWATPAAVPTLTQMLQAEAAPVRLLLVDLLAKTEGKEASIALAKRAIFDLSPEVRARAVRALATRPAAEYTATLSGGFRYPWPAAADHAAEAAVELKRTEMAPALVKLLKEPNPCAPVKVEGGYTVQEVVRINHLCNCMLCHPPSLGGSDSVRGGVAIPGQRFDPRYSRGSSDLFVRANLTYLRQDFSAVQPVAKPDKWPGEQRYDYLARTRPLSKAEQAAHEKLDNDKLPKTYPQQTSVLFALRELTGRDYGNTYEEWSDGLKKEPLPQPTKPPAP